MLRSLEKKMIGFLDFFYFFIFKKRVGETKIVFFKDIFVSALGNGLAGIFLFGTSILMGRMLGPAEYGKAGLAVSYGYLFLFLMAPGFNTAAVRYIANEGDEKEKGRIMTVVLTSTLASLVPVCVLFFFFYRPLSVFLQVDPLILFFGFVYAIPLALKNVFDGFTRGFRRFTLQLVARVGEAIVVFSVITFSLFFFHIRSFFVYSISLSIGLAVFCLLVFFPFFSSFGRFSFRILKKIIFYSFFAALGGVAGFLFLNINRIIVSYAVGASSVGLYMAYYTATFTFASQFLTIFNNVFFPMVSRMPKKRDIVRKINTLNKVLAVPLFGGIVAFGYFFLYLIFFDGIGFFCLVSPQY